MFCDYCGKFVGHAPWCREPKSTAVLTYGDTLVLTMPVIQNGSSFDVFLREEGIEDEVTIAATKKVLKAALDRIEALEWLLEVEGITFSDMDAMSAEGFREFREIRKKALRDAGEGGI